MRVTNCSYYGGSTFQVPITLSDLKRWVLLLPPVSFCRHDAPHIQTRKISPGKKEKINREKNLSATTDCVTSPSHPVTPPTRTPPSLLRMDRGGYSHSGGRIRAQSGEGRGGVNAPIRVQLLLSAVLKAHARKHARTDFEADLNHVKMEYFLLNVRCFFRPAP